MQDQGIFFHIQKRISSRHGVPGARRIEYIYVYIYIYIYIHICVREFIRDFINLEVRFGFL